MKVIAKQNRDLILINAQNTQNENDAEKILLQVPEKYEDYVKKIVFVTPEGTVWDLIENNEYLIKRAITKYEQVKFYIWLTKDDVDFRTQEKTLKFNLNHKVEGEVTPAEQSDIERVLSILDSEIIKVENLDIDAIKVGDTTTITITDKEGNEKSVKILDGKDGKDGTVGRDGVSPVITETKTQNGYDISITDITGTNTISLTNGDDGIDGQDGVDGISPILTETKTQNGYDVSITDKNGTRVISLTDGDDGQDGTNGVDGFSPTLTETQTQNGYNITITDANGTRTIQLVNGDNGAKGDKRR